MAKFDQARGLAPASATIDAGADEERPLEADDLKDLQEICKQESCAS